MITRYHALRCTHRSYAACSSSKSSSLRTQVTSARDVVQEGDVVLFKSGAGAKEYTGLTKHPLRHGGTIDNHLGLFRHSDIIGTPFRHLVYSQSKTGTRKSMSVHAPTLEEYVKLTPRTVTPIYAKDCNLIVSLLDINVRPPTCPDTPPADSPDLSILESGTGHGSLTLHLARAIQAANPALPESLLNPGFQKEDTKKAYEIQLADYKSKRRAVIHTVELYATNSSIAQKTVSGFRRGLYYPHIDFHSGNVLDFLQSQAHHTSPASSNPGQLYNHIILDLPATHNYISAAANALKVGGTLMVFCPSVTQVAQCVRAIREHNLPLTYSTVLELGTGMSGGRQWDVRVAKVRKPLEATSASADPSLQNTKSPEVTNITAAEPRTFTQRMRSRLASWLLSDMQNHTVARAATATKASIADSTERWEMVARPSVGHRVAGGGFLGVWHKKRISISGSESLEDADADADADAEASAKEPGKGNGTSGTKARLESEPRQDKEKDVSPSDSVREEIGGGSGAGGESGRDHLPRRQTAGT